MRGRLVCRWAWLGVFLLFLLASGTATASTPDRFTPRIVGGGPALITQYPFQVAVYYPSAGTPHAGLTCGGSVIDATHVATAAHCVFNETAGRVITPGSLRVLAGTSHLDPPYPSPSQMSNVGVRATSFHPAYNPAVNDYDVAVLTLDSTLYTPSPTTTITPVAPAAADPPSGSTVYVSGWGATSENSSAIQQDLRATDVQLVDFTSTCQPDYGWTLTDRMICAAAPNHDSCSGDSGGPLVAPTGGPPSAVLVGIVSFGIGCARANYPGVYARVANPALSGFLTSTPPQAPEFNARPSLTGTPSPGQTLSCGTGDWTSNPGFLYRFARDTGGGFATALTQLSGANTYVVQAGDAGTNIFCRVRAINAGGYGEADSSDVAVGAAAPAPSPPAAIPNLAAPQDKKSPAASVAAKSCSRGRCTVNVRVIDPIPSSGIRALQATLSWKTRVSCRRRGRRTTCTRIHTRHPTVKAIGGGHFLVSAGHLKRGSYTLSVVPVDKAGNRPPRATVVALKLR